MPENEKPANHREESTLVVSGETLRARLAAIRERAAAATAGPWYATDDGRIIEGEGHVIADECGIWEDADAEFTAHAREDIPWLLDQLAAVLSRPSEGSEVVTTYTPMLWATLNDDQRYEEYVRVRSLLAKEAL